MAKSWHNLVVETYYAYVQLITEESVQGNFRPINFTEKKSGRERSILINSELFTYVNTVILSIASCSKNNITQY